MSLDLIPKSHVNEDYRCQNCVEAKRSRKPFKYVERKATLLELIHSDLCDSQRVLTHGGNQYFIAFIDDYSKCYYVYLTYLISLKFIKLKLKIIRKENNNLKV